MIENLRSFGASCLELDWRVCMKNVFIINAHEPGFGSYSPGRLNQSLVEKAKQIFVRRGFNVRTTQAAEPWTSGEEIDKHLWCDYLLIQSPVNWMSFPWSFKRYIDQVYTLEGYERLWMGTGRSRTNPEKNYGTKGGLKGRSYMFSLTFDAPSGAFDDPSEYLMQGRSVDDLFFPMHVTYRYLAMEALPTFSLHDVVVNPNVERDLERFGCHLEAHFC